MTASAGSGPAGAAFAAFGPIGFAEIADGVFVARTDPLDVNVTLVLGDSEALVIDTLSTRAQAEALLAAIRGITTSPLTVINTHFHFDHCFGNAVIAAGGRPIWAHPDAVRELRERGDHWRRRWRDDWASTEPALAEGLAAATIQTADHLVRATEVLDLGGRTVSLSHPGRGHTSGDVIAAIPDVDVIVAGDLIEESGPPDFSDAYPLEWPEAVAVLLRLTSPATKVIPGHGAVVDAAFVASAHAELAALDWLIRDGHADGATAGAVADRSPLDRRQSIVAVRRGYAELDGAPPN